MRRRFPLWSELPEVAAAIADLPDHPAVDVDAESGAQSDELGGGDTHGVDDVTTA